MLMGWVNRRDWNRNRNTQGLKSRTPQELKMNSQNFNNSIFQYSPSAPIPLLVCDTCNVTRENPRVWCHCSRFPRDCWPTTGRVPKNETINDCRGSNGQQDVPKSPAQFTQKNSTRSLKEIRFSPSSIPPGLLWFPDFIFWSWTADPLPGRPIWYERSGGGFEWLLVWIWLELIMGCFGVRPGGETATL